MKTSEWIRVEDRLPEYETQAGGQEFALVLVCLVIL